MASKWEKVYVFISSTFNDMHAERDYLVKRVFPELQDWCERRRLRLVDIDLRWGVTEQDATHNKNVVKVCLNRIDDCRPFFLCFLGQRRGWVPSENEVSAETFDSFPDLSNFVGETSVTELEILHALINPLHQSGQHDPRKSKEYYKRVQYAFFYLRDPSYLDGLPTDTPELRQVYTNEWVDDPAECERHDSALRKWREEEIPQSGRPVRIYEARWDRNASTPELTLPLQCPSVEPVNIDRWRRQWSKAGVAVTGLNVEDDPDEADKVRQFNGRLTTGRLTHFRCAGDSLHQVILNDLKEAIAGRYPDHDEVILETELEKEHDQQEHFLFVNTEGFIERGDDFAEMDEYVESDTNQIFALTASGGMGKTMLLANWVDRYRKRIGGREDRSIHFRFIGASDRSSTINWLLRDLLLEMKEAGSFESGIPDDPVKLRSVFPEMLREVGQRGKSVIVIDGLNQLETGLSDLSWLPNQLPDNIKFIVSFKRGDKESEDLYGQYRQDNRVILSEVKPFTNVGDRRKLVRAYLSQYLKELDEQNLESLIASEGAENPLYLKVVLSELRVFGAFASLREQISNAFGNNPVSAFEGVLRRLETDPVYTPLDPGNAIPLIFGLLAHARRGLAIEELVDLIRANYSWPADSAADSTTDSEAASAMRCDQARETVNLYFRQVRPFLIYREGRYDFFYESFKLASERRYVGEPSEVRPLNRDVPAWHRLLVNYLEACGDEYPRTLNDYVFHLVGAGDDEGIKKCFREGFLRKKKSRGFLLDEIQSDFLLALTYFQDKHDAPSMFIITSTFRRDVSGVNLFNHESFLIWHGAILAANDDQLKIHRTASYIARQPPNSERSRMIAEFLIGLGEHPQASQLRELHSKELESAVASSEENSGLDLLAAEALGDVEHAFSLAIQTPSRKFSVQELRDELLHPRICRILKLIRRHPNQPDAPALIERLLATLGHRGSFNPSFPAVIASFGLLGLSEDAKKLRERLVATIHGTNFYYNSLAALHIAAFLSNDPELVFPVLNRTITMEIPNWELLRLALLYLGWFNPALEEHDLVNRLVTKLSKRMRLVQGFPSWQSRVLKAHFNELRLKDDSPHEGILVPIFALWARLLHQLPDDTNVEIETLTSEALDGLLPNFFRSVFKRDDRSYAAWIEMGEALCAAKNFELSRHLHKQFQKVAETPRHKASGLSFFGQCLWWTLSALIILASLLFLGFVFVHSAILYPEWMIPLMILLILTVGLSLIVFDMHPPIHIQQYWWWVRPRPASDWLIRLLERRRESGKNIPWWVWWMKPWQYTIVEAEQKEMAIRALQASKLSLTDLFRLLLVGTKRKNLRYFIWLCKYILDRRTDPDKEDWLALAQEILLLSESSQAGSLPASGLRLVAKGRLALTILVDIVRKFTPRHHVVLGSEQEIGQLAAAIVSITNEKELIKALRAIRLIELGEPHRVVSSVLQVSVMQPRRTFVKILQAITRWKTIRNRDLVSQMRKEYVATVQEEYPFPSWFSSPLLFMYLRSLYRFLLSLGGGEEHQY